jgi:hypothetical protein
LGENPLIIVRSRSKLGHWARELINIVSSAAPNTGVIEKHLFYHLIKKMNVAL